MCLSGCRAAWLAWTLLLHLILLHNNCIIYTIILEIDFCQINRYFCFRMNWSVITELAKFEISNPINGFESLLILEGIWPVNHLFIQGFLMWVITCIFRARKHSRCLGCSLANLCFITIPPIIDWTCYINFLWPCSSRFLPRSDSSWIRSLFARK